MLRKIFQFDFPHDAIVSLPEGQGEQRVLALLLNAAKTCRCKKCADSPAVTIRKLSFICGDEDEALQFELSTNEVKHFRV